jgi:hypothetical protein
MGKPAAIIDPVREARAVQALRESLAAVDAHDETLLTDTIEGETGLFEALDLLLDRMTANRATVAGIAAVIADLETRKARFEKRIEADRAVIEQALMIAELPKVERPIATLYLSARAPKVEIATEADIPAEFWKTAPPTLDKRAIGEALKSGRSVPGAHLSNAAPTLSARFQ